MKNFEGYLKQKLGNDYVLLAGGSHKTLSDFLMSSVAANTYLLRNTNSEVLSQFSGSPSYLLGIEAFADGGTIKWQSTSNITVGQATNADTVDGYHASGFLAWAWDNTTGSGSPFQASVDYFKDLTKLNNGAKLVYNSSGAEYTILYSRRSDATAHGSILKWGYPDNYIRIIRMVSGNPQSSDWEKISAGYADSAGTLNGMSRNSSNNWSGTGLSLLMGMSDSSGGDCLFLTNNSGQMSFCIDGCLYQRIDSTGASRRCLDTYDISNTTWGTATYSTYTTYLNASYTIGGSTWDWNPFSATQYYVWGQQFRISSVSSDTGDMRLYLSPNPPGCGGMGICLNMDGYISTLSQMYAGNGFYTGSDRRFKNNIKEIKIDKMLPIKQFNLKSDNTHSYGFIAQELEEAGYSELVINGSEYKSVNYNAALSLCVAILSNIVEDNKLKIKELEAKILELERRLT